MAASSLLTPLRSVIPGKEVEEERNEEDEEEEEEEERENKGKSTMTKTAPKSASAGNGRSNHYLWGRNAHLEFRRFGNGFCPFSGRIREKADGNHVRLFKMLQKF